MERHAGVSERWATVLFQTGPLETLKEMPCGNTLPSLRARIDCDGERHHHGDGRGERRPRGNASHGSIVPGDGCCDSCSITPRSTANRAAKSVIPGTDQERSFFHGRSARYPRQRGLDRCITANSFPWQRSAKAIFARPTSRHRESNGRYARAHLGDSTFFAPRVAHHVGSPTPTAGQQSRTGSFCVLTSPTPKAIPDGTWSRIEKDVLETRCPGIYRSGGITVSLDEARASGAMNVVSARNTPTPAGWFFNGRVQSAESFWGGVRNPLDPTPPTSAAFEVVVEEECFRRNAADPRPLTGERGETAPRSKTNIARSKVAETRLQRGNMPQRQRKR